jgi:hypothetical protein
MGGSVAWNAAVSVTHFEQWCSNRSVVPARRARGSQIVEWLRFHEGDHTMGTDIGLRSLAIVRAG